MMFRCFEFNPNNDPKQRKDQYLVDGLLLTFVHQLFLAHDPTQTDDRKHGKQARDDCQVERERGGVLVVGVHTTPRYIDQ